MQWLIAFGIASSCGFLGWFLFFAFMALALPRTLQVFIYLVYGPMTFFGMTGIIWIGGMLFGFLPISGASFDTSMKIAIIPAILWTHYIARDAWSMSEGRR